MVDEIRTIPPKLTKTEWNALLDHALIKPTTYIIYKVGTEYRAVNGMTGKVDYYGTDATTVIQSAIDALPTSGGKILMKEGKYVLGTKIVINKNSVELAGTNKGGDLFFTNDGTYHGQSNKMATLIIADGIDGIHVGETTFVQGIAINNLFISGTDSDEALGDDVYSIGAGIKLENVNTVSIENVQVRHKEYGLYTKPTEPFAWNHVIDVLTINNLYLCYNLYGWISEGFVSNVRVHNLFGYINQRGVLHVTPQYNWLIDGVWSNADCRNPLTDYDCSIFVSTARDVTLRNIVVAGAYGTTLSSKPLIRIDVNVSGTPESYRGRVLLEDIVLFETQQDAIRIAGTGHIFIHNIHAGSTGTEGFYGGSGTITEKIVNNLDPSTAYVEVIGGYVKSALANKADWFAGVKVIKSLINWSITDKVEPVTFNDHIKLESVKKLCSKNFAGTAIKDLIYLDSNDRTQLMMHGGDISDISNSPDATLSGTPKVITLYIAGTPYYFKVYQTKT